MTISTSTPIEWDEWRVQTQRLYEPYQGWPSSEMRAYWSQGLSPLEASDKAKSRRRRPGAVPVDADPHIAAY
jgi:hypothetical protein